VIETTGATSAQTVKITPAAGFNNAAITIFTSNDTKKEYFNNLGRFTLPKSGLTMQVQPNSIVTVSTLSGQSKGLAYQTVPASAPFPANYTDNFESYTRGETNIANFAPQQGAYEIQACGGGRSGQCLGQVAPALPVIWQTWAPASDPFVMLGDERSIDGSVAVDVLLPATSGSSVNYVGVGGHSLMYPNNGYQGYRLLIYSDGGWGLSSAFNGQTAYLATNTSAPSAINRIQPGWHKLSLSVGGGATAADITTILKGQTITATIDGTTVASIPAPAWNSGGYPFGQPALLSNYSAAQYDNLTLTSALRQPLGVIPVFQAAYEAEDGARSGTADIEACSACSGGNDVGYLGSDGSVTIGGISVPADGLYDVAISYTNGFATPVNGQIVVNGGANPISIAFPPTGGWWSPALITITVNLKQGGSNSLQFNNSTNIDGIGAPALH
jgi:hypothetical protein